MNRMFLESLRFVFFRDSTLCNAGLIVLKPVSLVDCGWNFAWWWHLSAKKSWSFPLKNKLTIEKSGRGTWEAITVKSFRRKLGCCG